MGAPLPCALCQHDPRAHHQNYHGLGPRCTDCPAEDSHRLTDRIER